MYKPSPLIICGFPGIGKSYVTKHINHLKSHDSDSSHFDKSDFPNNYIQHIKNLYETNDCDVIFVSTHKEVRDALIKENLPHYVYYPNIHLKEIFITRYKNRGSSKAFIDFMESHFELFVNEIIEESKFHHPNVQYVEIDTDDINQFANEIVSLIKK